MCHADDDALEKLILTRDKLLDKLLIFDDNYNYNSNIIIVVF